MTASHSYNIRYFAILREQRGLNEETLSSPAMTAQNLYEELSTRYNFTLPAHKIRAAVNEKFVAMDAALQDGDEIVFIPPVAGG